jgi:hypothetical protein
MTCSLLPFVKSQPPFGILRFQPQTPQREAARYDWIIVGGESCAGRTIGEPDCGSDGTIQTLKWLLFKMPIARTGLETPAGALTR